MTQDRTITEDEALEDVSTFFYMKEHFEARTAAPAEWRRLEARKLLAHTLDISALMCGPEVLTLAYGTASSDDRKDHLLALADRLHWPAQLFAGIMPNARQDSFEALADECESIARGDAPVLTAKLPGYRKKVRLLVAKFRANRWNAYLDGLGIATVDRHSALADAFGQEWDTMSRWTSDAIATWGAKPINDRLRMDCYHGSEDLRRVGVVGDAHWRSAVTRSGRIFKRQAGYAA